jgi:predicted nucleic acid-binding protein
MRLTRLHRLSNSIGWLCVDASAIINLNASQCAPDILRALPERLLVIDIVVRELEEGRKNGREDAQMLEQLLQAQLIETNSLNEPDELMFEALVSGPAATTLDDGEAATIAYAAGRSLPIVLDDQKARRVWQKGFSHLSLRSSVDLFRHPDVQHALGQERLAAGVFHALKTARMRVLAEHTSWVTTLIGEANAQVCRSLPRRHRMPEAAQTSTRVGEPT